MSKKPVRHIGLDRKAKGENELTFKNLPRSFE